MTEIEEMRFSCAIAIVATYIEEMGINQFIDKVCEVSEINGENNPELIELFNVVRELVD